MGKPAFSMEKSNSLSISKIKKKEEENMGIFSHFREKSKENKENEKAVYSPLAGEVIPLESVNDEAFAEKSMGDGIAIQPSEGKLYAPLSGVVQALFPTGHAIAITGDNGIGVMLHIGIDTVELEGNGFTPHVKQEDRVEKGQLLITFDIEKIRAKGYEVTTMIVLPESEELGEIKKRESGTISPQEKLLWL